MPDTQRSLEAILALMSDNHAGLISPQDVRDMIVSLANAPGIEEAAVMVGDPTAIPFATGMDVPNATATFVPWADSSVTGYHYDPQGWFQFADDYESPDWYALTVPAGSWFLLPEGVYHVAYFASWDTDTTGYRQAFLADTCDNRVVDPDLDPWAFDPMYVLYLAGWGVNVNANALTNFGSFTQQAVSTVIRVTADTAPVAFASQVAQNSGSTRKLRGANLAMLRTSRVGG